MDGSISRIATDREDLFAFRIRGSVTAEAMDDMAQLMNTAFDRFHKVDMLLIFDAFEGAEAGSSFDLDVIRAQFRSLVKVDHYVVVGAPQGARTMIEIMDKVIPVEAVTFDRNQEQQAWDMLNARPVAAGV